LIEALSPVRGDSAIPLDTSRILPIRARRSHLVASASAISAVSAHVRSLVSVRAARSSVDLWLLR